MRPRIVALEAAIARIEPMIIRIDERTAYLATKEDVALVRSDLALKADRSTVWAVGLTIGALVVGALATGAVYMPYVATLLRRSVG